MAQTGVYNITHTYELNENNNIFSISVLLSPLFKIVNFFIIAVISVQKIIFFCTLKYAEKLKYTLLPA